MLNKYKFLLLDSNSLLYLIWYLNWTNINYMCEITESNADLLFFHKLYTKGQAH